MEVFLIPSLLIYFVFVCERVLTLSNNFPLFFEWLFIFLIFFPERVIILTDFYMLNLYSWNQLCVCMCMCVYTNTTSRSLISWIQFANTLLRIFEPILMRGIYP